MLSMLKVKVMAGLICFAIIFSVISENSFLWAEDNQESSSKFRVIIDGSKGNQYVTGDYAGKVNNLKEELAKRDCLVDINEETITKEALKNVELLIITDPEGKSDKKGNYSQEELDAIRDYVALGGHIIVCTRDDVEDGKGEYSNSAQINPMLEAIGTKLRVNDDQVVDEENNEGQSDRLMFYTYESKNFNLVKDLTETDLYSFNSGASVILADGENEQGIDYIVKGHTTTQSINKDGEDDYISVEKGNVVVLAAEKLNSGAKVIVSGNAFLSDFEIGEENQKSNRKILSRIFDWILPKKEVQKLSIAEFRKDENKDGKPDLIGQDFILEGTVTVQSEAVQPKNAFVQCIYIEDETGGINVFGVSTTPLKVGQKLKVKGIVGEYEGETQIIIENEAEDIEIIDESINEISPIKMTTADSILAENQGKLIQVVGNVTKVDIEKGNLYINDGSGEVRVYLDRYIGDGETEESRGKFGKDIKVGSKVSAIGLASKDSQGSRLRVRNTLEVKVLEEVVPPNSESVENDSNKEDNNNEQDKDITEKPQTGKEEDSTEKTDLENNHNSAEILGEYGENAFNNEEDYKDIQQKGNRATRVGLAIIIGGVLGIINLNTKFD